MKLLNKSWPLLILFLTVILYFKPFIFSGKVPIPTDTIVGMYHPWRDKIWDNFTAGVPFKNFLITDPVRQQYPWRELAISLLKKGELPLWNPYSFSGTPLLANMQSAAFYPLNILFWILPSITAWSILIVLEPILGGFFLYLYLRFFKIEKIAALIGSLSFAFSGFFVAWSEWGTIVHAALWLPLILLAIENIVFYFPRNKLVYCSSEAASDAASRELSNNTSRFGRLWRPLSKNKYLTPDKKLYIWIFIFIFSLSSSFLAGHLQIFFYIFLLTFLYTIVRLLHLQENRKILISIFLILNSIFLILVIPQLLSTIQFISQSGRSFDQINWQIPGWFIPWQHLIQFLAPDFFGNPSTLNYWGEWNYGEFVGYIGILPLMFTLFAILFRRDKKTLFFSLLALLALIFALPTPLARLPYELKIPLLSTSQPTRLLFLVDFSLSILAALGVDYLLKLSKEKRISLLKLFPKEKTTEGSLLTPVYIIGGLLITLFLATIFGDQIWTSHSWVQNLPIAKRNLYLPLALTGITGLFLFLFWLNHNVKNLKLQKIIKKSIFIGIISVTVFDLVRFSTKFNSFSNSNWLFPNTTVIEYLKNDPEIFRIMPTDRRILPPNFSAVYRLQSIEGYDPLFIGRYGELMAAWARNKPDITPFSFNRIITPQDYESRLADLLNVKYVLSLREEESEKLEKVFQEGETRLYRNKKVLPRIFFVNNVKSVKDKQEAINALFDPAIDFAKTAVIEENNPQVSIEIGEVKIDQYGENEIRIRSSNNGLGFLVLSDVYYPSWKAKIDGISTKIYITDYTLRGIFVPKGNHEVVFKIKLL